MSDLDPVTAGIIRTLTRKVTGLEGRVRSIARASQARHRSVEGGTQSLYDEDDELRAVVGQLADGAYGVATFGGEVPPIPSAPLVAPTPDGVTITWDGFDAGDEQGWPENFARVRVHQSTLPGDPPDAENIIGSFESSAGGAMTIAHPSDVTTFVYFVAVTTSGLESAPSVEVEATGGQYSVPQSGSLAASGVFTGDASVYRFGDMALVTVNIERPVGFDAGFTATGIVLPDGFRPPVGQVAPASPFYATTEHYQFRVLATGVVEVRQTGSQPAQNMRATLVFTVA